MEKLEISVLSSGPAVVLLTWGILSALDSALSPTYNNPSIVSNTYDNLVYGIPGDCDQIINREGYALGYIEDWEQPAWVSYRLTAEEATSHKVDRGDYFIEDSEILTGSATLADYLHSGYDRGHLAPAADMRWSAKTMRESFLLSNMSPQVPDFNRGIWRHAESYAREMAQKEQSVFIITGPIFYSGMTTNRIGRNKIAVPHAYYKIIYDETPPTKMVGLVIPNMGTNASVNVFTTSVQRIEQLTGLHFFELLEME